jgi:DNA-binding SARP family transcriptional activator
MGRESGSSAAPSRLALTDEFDLVLRGRQFGVPHSIERVIAYLGIASQPVHRSRIAGALWPEVNEAHAARSLRTALWRLHRGGHVVVDVRGDRVALADGIDVDVKELIALCRLILEGNVDALSEVDRLVDHGDLLPDWDDEWVVADRERFHLLRISALETAAERLIETDEHRRAMDLVLCAIASDPLRESARRLAMSIHLAEGNPVSAHAVYQDYRALLASEVGVSPSPAMRRLLGPSGADPAPRDASGGLLTASAKRRDAQQTVKS